MSTLCKFATTDVTCVSEDASLLEAAELMKKNNIGSVVIVKDKKTDLTPTGILTDRDIVVQLLANEVDPKAVCVKDVARKELMTVKETDPIQDVIQRMEDKGVRRAPLVDKANKVVGIVSLDDLFVTLAAELYHLSCIVKKQKD